MSVRECASLLLADGFWDGIERASVSAYVANVD